MSDASRLNATVLNAETTFLDQSLVTPLQLSSGAISQITELRVTVRVRVEGREVSGQGSIYLSDLWAWPEPSLSHDQRDAVLRGISERIAAHLPALCGGEAAHPMELGLRLHDAVCEHDKVGDPQGAKPSKLALAMCLSPFDAAIHDAVGQAHERSAFDFYRDPVALPSVDRLFPGGSAQQAIADTIQPPRRELDAWLIVGKNDDLEKDTAPWARDRGYRCFKLKLMGRDNAFDVARTAEVYRAAKRWGIEEPRLSVDTNEANPDAASVLDYLERLRSIDAEAFEALAYLEQPTGRDFLKHRFDWRAVTKLKPVLLDEGLTSLEQLDAAAEQGWSGLALKTCKGHSFALAAAAWSRQRGMVLAMQDLTNPGFSAIHAALFAAHVPMLNGVELNAAQFTPDANAPWLPRLADLLAPRNGRHRLPLRVPAGLGSGL